MQLPCHGSMLASCEGACQSDDADRWETIDLIERDTTRRAEPPSHSRTPPEAGKEKPRRFGVTRTAGKIAHSVPRARRGASQMLRRRGDDVLGTRHVPTLRPAGVAFKDPEDYLAPANWCRA